MLNTSQLDLFSAVQHAYLGGSLDNESLYEQLVQQSVLKIEQSDERQQAGESGKRYCTAKRRVRWIQQTLKTMGLLEGAGMRGQWRLTERGRRGLTPAQPRKVL